MQPFRHSAQSISLGRPQIITIGSGKGGVGKTTFSLLAANLLSQRFSVVLVDAGFGSDYFGLLIAEDRKPALRDFGSLLELNGLVRKTRMRNLAVLKLPLQTVLSPSGYWEHQQLLKGLRNITADFVLVDMAPLTSYRMLDLFLCGDRRLVLTTNDLFGYELTKSAILNLLVRNIEKSFKKAPNLTRLVNDYFNGTTDITFGEYLQRCDSVAAETRLLLRKYLAGKWPNLIVNGVKGAESLLDDFEILFNRMEVSSDSIYLLRYSQSARNVSRPGYLFQKNGLDDAARFDVEKILQRCILPGKGIDGKKLNEEKGRQPVRQEIMRPTFDHSTQREQHVEQPMGGKANSTVSNVAIRKAAF